MHSVTKNRLRLNVKVERLHRIIFGPKTNVVLLMFFNEVATPSVEAEQVKAPLS